MLIWSYWVGPCPPWIDLCLQTLRRHNPEVQVLDDSVWDTLYQGPVPPEVIRRQAPNVQSDYLRAWLLTVRGGIWVDADGICFRSIAAPLEDYLGEADFLAYRKPRMMSALLACRPGSRIAAEYLAEMVRRLNGGQRHLPPLALGPAVLRRAIAVTGARCATVPTHLVHPLQGHRFGPSPVLAERAGTWYADPDALYCMLTHRALGRLAKRSASWLLQSRTVCGVLLRRALGHPEPEPRSPARVIVGVMSGDQYADRRRLCCETWLRELEYLGCATMFLRGDAAAMPAERNTLSIPVRDDNLSAKTQAFCRWALAQGPAWDYVFKCDDDTLIHPQRFAVALEDLDADYIGGKWRPACTYASGGGGYFLSRRAVEIIAAADMPPIWAEDRQVGEVLAAAGIPLTEDRRFHARARPGWRAKCPDWITVHGIRDPDRWQAVWTCGTACTQAVSSPTATDTA
jgi:hypothetical protein